MLSLLGSIIRLAVFSAIVLALGHVIHWRGKTLSDQVKVGMAQAQRTEAADRVKHWSRKVAQEAQKASGAGTTGLHQEIPLSERQKLKDLIRELNSSH